MPRKFRPKCKVYPTSDPNGRSPKWSKFIPRFRPTRLETIPFGPSLHVYKVLPLQDKLASQISNWAWHYRRFVLPKRKKNYMYRDLVIVMDNILGQSEVQILLMTLDVKSHDVISELPTIERWPPIYCESAIPETEWVRLIDLSPLTFSFWYNKLALSSVRLLCHQSKHTIKNHVASSRRKTR